MAQVFPFVAEDVLRHTCWVGSNTDCSRDVRLGFEDMLWQPVLLPGELRPGSTSAAATLACSWDRLHPRCLQLMLKAPLVQRFWAPEAATSATAFGQMQCTPTLFAGKRSSNLQARHLLEVVCSCVMSMVALENLVEQGFWP